MAGDNDKSAKNPSDRPAAAFETPRPERAAAERVGARRPGGGPEAQIGACAAIAQQARMLADQARAADLPFLVYLLEMAQAAALDERERLTRD